MVEKSAWGGKDRIDSMDQDNLFLKMGHNKKIFDMDIIIGVSDFTEILAESVKVSMSLRKNIHFCMDCIDSHNSNKNFFVEIEIRVSIDDLKIDRIEEPVEVSTTSPLE